MAKKKAEKVGFRDLVAFAKAGWTPDETNALLDRLEQMGDPLSPPELNDEDPYESEEDDEDPGESEDSDDPGESEEDEDPGESEEDDEDGEPEEESNLDKMKKISLEVENQRLKKELKKLQAVNKNKDVSSKKPPKSLEDSLIDAFQSCF